MFLIKIYINIYFFYFEETSIITIIQKLEANIKGAYSSKYFGICFMILEKEINMG